MNDSGVLSCVQLTSYLTKCLDRLNCRIKEYLHFGKMIWDCSWYSSLWTRGTVGQTSHPYHVHCTLTVLCIEITKMNKTWSLPWRNSAWWARHLCEEVIMIHFDKCCNSVICKVLCVMGQAGDLVVGWRTLIIQHQGRGRSLLCHKDVYQFCVIYALF